MDFKKKNSVRKSLDLLGTKLFSLSKPLIVVWCARFQEDKFLNTTVFRQRFFIQRIKIIISVLESNRALYFQTEVTFHRSKQLQIGVKNRYYMTVEPREAWGLKQLLKNMEKIACFARKPNGLQFKIAVA